MIGHGRRLFEAFKAGLVVAPPPSALVGPGQWHDLGRGPIDRPRQDRAWRRLQRLPDPGRHGRLPLVTDCACKHNLRILYLRLLVKLQRALSRISCQRSFRGQVRLFRVRTEGKLHFGCGRAAPRNSRLIPIPVGIKRPDGRGNSATGLRPPACPPSLCAARGARGLELKGGSPGPR